MFLQEETPWDPWGLSKLTLLEILARLKPYHGYIAAVFWVVGVLGLINLIIYEETTIPRDKSVKSELIRLLFSSMMIGLGVHFTLLAIGVKY